MSVAQSDRFDVRMQQLAERVGTGKMTGSVVVDQVYAKFQHESLDLRHPNGGQAKFLSEPLMKHHREYLTFVAERLLREGPEAGMKQSMDYLSAEVLLNAPVEFGDLRRSGSPSVTDGATEIYRKPPIQRRLTALELAAKSKLRHRGGR